MLIGLCVLGRPFLSYICVVSVSPSESQTFLIPSIPKSFLGAFNVKCLFPLPPSHGAVLNFWLHSSTGKDYLDISDLGPCLPETIFTDMQYLVHTYKLANSVFMRKAVLFILSSLFEKALSLGSSLPMMLKIVTLLWTEACMYMYEWRHLCTCAYV